MILFTQNVLDEIGQQIARHPPERGGALMLISNSSVVVEFVSDPEARVSGSTYFPSEQLTEKVRGREMSSELRFGGIVHSHPSRMTHPSGQDHRAFALGLALNPHIAAFIAPIVTMDYLEGPVAPNEIELSPRGKMTMHLAYRRQYTHQRGQSGSYRGCLSASSTDPRNDGIELYDVGIGVLPVDSDVNTLLQVLERDRHKLTAHNTSYQTLNGTPFIVSTFNFSEFELLMMFPLGYPFVPPFSMLTRNGGDAQQLKFKWSVGNGHFRLSDLHKALSEKLDLVSRHD